MKQHSQCPVAFPAGVMRFIEVGGDGFPTRQVDALSDDRIFRYSRSNPSDSVGAISIQNIRSIDQNGHVTISEDEFEHWWERAATASNQPQDYECGSYRQFSDKLTDSEIPSKIRHLYKDTKPRK